jgi:hypothetical protein
MLSPHGGLESAENFVINEQAFGEKTIAVEIDPKTAGKAFVQKTIVVPSTQDKWLLYILQSASARLQH